MISSYRSVRKFCAGEVTEKKSRFIAGVYPVKTEAEANEILAAVRKKYWDARHNCYAYILMGEDGKLIKKFSDDGEPSQTAGKPMMDVMEGMELCNVLVVVTRYFGGVLLGTGGLVRAYSAAAKEGIEAGEICTYVLADRMKVETDYNGAGKIQYLLGQLGISAACEYSDKVILSFACPAEKTGRLVKEITEATNARAVITDEGQDFAQEQ